MIIDPSDENVAVDNDGELTFAVRILPIKEGYAAPTVEELSNAPILGYSRGLITSSAEDLHDTE